MTDQHPVRNTRVDGGKLRSRLARLGDLVLDIDRQPDDQQEHLRNLQAEWEVMDREYRAYVDEHCDADAPPDDDDRKRRRPDYEGPRS